ncbi:GNAT family N-acetyltransferase [Brevundimonas sp. 2R-24]|uniref:GNAT family N-acetyltransferase n=1 Tax=Peiella sedimenti TaxID=3061083 RepID=A0ABT8SJK2_9CAUL|nr:GNAT family N-acetyltransferase [Caulobacteraceae bacterium XZ-24]
MLRVRQFDAADAEALSRVYRRSVEGLGASDYAPDQIAAWAGLAPSAERLIDLMADGRLRLVALDQDRPVGFIDVERDGHIHFLYRAPDAPRGAADALYVQAESWSRAQGLQRLFAEASEAAKRFFLRHGFSVVSRRDFEVSGVPIHNYAVEKRL